MRSAAPVLLVLFLAVSAFGDRETPLRAVEPREATASELRASARDGRNLLLRTAVFDPAIERPDFTKVGLPGGTNTSAYAILQFQPGQSAKKAELERLGVKFLGSLSDHAYLVHVPPTLRSPVGGHPAVRWLGDYEPGFKVHPRLWPSRGGQILEIRVATFPGGSVTKTLELLRRATPGLVVTKKLDDAYAHFVEVSVPAGSAVDFVRRASAIEGVAWIEPNDELQLYNSSSSGAIQGNQVTEGGRVIFAHGITGTGQIVAVADSGLDSDACYFRSLNGRDAVTDATSAITEDVGPLFPENKIIGYWVQEDADAYDEADFHGTHTSGSVAGDNFAHPSSATSPGLDPSDGMAPNAQILFQDIGSADGKLRGVNPYTMFLQALRGGARVHSNSYGSDSDGAYTLYDQLVDQYLFDHDDMSVVFAAGNSGPAASSTGSPGNAKNVLTVGAVGSGVSTRIANFSSRGPTADGRIKPDIVGPGVGIFSAAGDANHGNGNCGPSSKQGTSMSTPTVAGGAALLRQYFADGYYPSGTKNTSDGVSASATLVKAVLLNGTLHLPASEPFGNPAYGWGKIFLDNNLYFPGDARRLRVWDLPNAAGLSTAESSTFTVSVAAGQEFRATLVWTDPEGTPGAARVLVNDLDLTVTNSAGTFLGNVNTAGESVTGGSADRLNNVEQVRFTSPVGGTYTIKVHAASVPGNGRSGTDHQGFALVVSAANCSGAVSAAPSGLQARTNATRGIDLTWTPAAGATVTQIYRSTGSNPNPAEFRYLGSTTGGTFTDRRAQGGYTYSYMLRGADDCSEGPASSPLSFTATGLCDIAPTFSGLATAQPDTTNCRIVLTWGAATSNCPLGATVRYNVYRSTSPSFVPQGAPYATTSATTYSDISVVSGTTYHYIVRAEDSTNASSGPNQGNQERNETRLYATAFGPPGPAGTWRDGAGDGGAFLTSQAPWQISLVEGHTGTSSYHNGVDNDLYQRDTCASITTPAIPLEANAELSYFARYNLEFEWDGVIVEISDDDGATWAALPPAGGYPATLAQTQGESGDQAPANSCGDLKTTPAFTGPLDNPGLTPWTEYKSSLASFAGRTVKIRWRFTSDPGKEFEGFYLDDIAITNAKLATSCTPLLVRPEAAFQLIPGIPARGKPVQFQDKSTSAPTSWRWEFGDGTPSSTLQNPTHTYDTAGTFQVKLTVTNAAGTSSVTRSVTVEEPSGGKRRRSVRG